MRPCCLRPTRSSFARSARLCIFAVSSSCRIFVARTACIAGSGAAITMSSATTVPVDEILSGTRWAWEQGYGSVVLQSGERSDPAFVDLITELVTKIRGPLEQSARDYVVSGRTVRGDLPHLVQGRRERYLLRIETSDPELYRRLHPCGSQLGAPSRLPAPAPRHRYQLGSGVMIGLPGQSVEQLARDILFFYRTWPLSWLLNPGLATCNKRPRPLGRQRFRDDRVPLRWRRPVCSPQRGMRQPRRPVLVVRPDSPNPATSPRNKTPPTSSELRRALRALRDDVLSRWSVACYPCRGAGRGLSPRSA